MPSIKKVAEKHNKLYEETPVVSIGPLDNSRFRLLGDWSANDCGKQTWPPTVPVSRTFPFNKPPEAYHMEYEGRITDAEAKAREAQKIYERGCIDFRFAAEVHKQARKYIQSIIYDGMPLIDIANKLETKYAELIEPSGLKRGRGFPTGLSMNNVAAHYTPNYSDDSIKFTDKDIMKVDFGVHVNGRIIDSAFSLCMDERLDPLIESTKQGTWTAIKMAGPDTPFSDISNAVDEVISSYEVEIDGATKKVRPITNLNGHTMLPYIIHAGKSLPCSKSRGNTLRMEEGEVYAIETFASTGAAYVQEEGECSHYMVPNSHSLEGNDRIGHNGRVNLLDVIKQKHGTLAFCKKWLHEYYLEMNAPMSWNWDLEELVRMHIIDEYPPLVDIPGCHTSQSEHCLWLKPTGKEIFSKGDDY